MIFIIIFASFPNAHGIVEEPGKVMCLHKEGFEDMGTAYNAVWIFFYFMLPALIIISFNAATLVRLRKTTTIYETMTSDNNASSQTKPVPATLPNEYELSSTANIDITKAPSSTVTMPESKTSKSGEMISSTKGVK